jgi:hypothetical protein
MCGIGKPGDEHFDHCGSIDYWETEGRRANVFLPNAENDKPTLRVVRDLKPSRRLAVVQEPHAVSGQAIWIAHGTSLVSHLSDCRAPQCSRLSRAPSRLRAVGRQEIRVRLNLHSAE